LLARVVRFATASGTAQFRASAKDGKGRNCGCGHNNAGGGMILETLASVIIAPMISYGTFWLECRARESSTQLEFLKLLSAAGNKHAGEMMGLWMVPGREWPLVSGLASGLAGALIFLVIFVVRAGGDFETLHRYGSYYVWGTLCAGIIDFAIGYIFSQFLYRRYAASHTGKS
jgi:hypothetical protein